MQSSATFTPAETLIRELHCCLFPLWLQHPFAAPSERHCGEETSMTNFYKLPILSNRREHADPWSPENICSDK